MNPTTTLPIPSAVESLMEQAIREGVFPGAVLAAGLRGEVVLHASFGRFTYSHLSGKVTPDTLFDIASLTKVIATTTMAMLLDERGRLELDRPVADYLPEFTNRPELVNRDDAARKKVTSRHLLAHNSGLPAYCPYYRSAGTGEMLLRALFDTPVECEPGTRMLYSDPGVILLGKVLERIAGEPLDQFFGREIAEPLGLVHTGFCPPRRLRPFIAPTELDGDFRKRLVQGEVHDENAWVLGGVAGHAGLFSTSGDVARFAQMMLEEGQVGGHPFLQRKTIRSFLERQGPEGRRLGWDLPTPGGSTGSHFPATSFGHLGYTGASLWIDPENQLYVALLNNRVYPTRENKKISEFRPRIHNAVVEACRGVL